MSKVWEMVSLDGGDAVTLRVSGYYLTFANVRCMYGGNDDTIIVLDKLTGKIILGPRTLCYAQET